MATSVPTWKIYMKNGQPLLSGGPNKQIAKECCCCDYPTIVITVTANDAQLPIEWCGKTWVKSIGGGGPAELGTNQRRSGESAEICPDIFTCGSMDPEDYPPLTIGRAMATGMGDTVWRFGASPAYAPLYLRKWGIISIYAYWGPYATQNTHYRVGVRSFSGSVWGNPGNPNIAYTPWFARMHNTLQIEVQTSDTVNFIQANVRQDNQYFVRVPLASGFQPQLNNYVLNGARGELGKIAKQTCSFGCSSWLTSSAYPRRVRGPNFQFLTCTGTVSCYFGLVTTGGGRTFQVGTKTYTTGGRGLVNNRTLVYDYASGLSPDWFGSHTEPSTGTIYTWERGRGWENNAGCSGW